MIGGGGIRWEKVTFTRSVVLKRFKNKFKLNKLFVLSFFNLFQVHSIEKRTTNIIKTKCPPNADLRIPSNWNQMKKSACKFIFNCLQENIL